MCGRRNARRRGTAGGEVEERKEKRKSRSKEEGEGGRPIDCLYQFCLVADPSWTLALIRDFVGPLLT